MKTSLGGEPTTHSRSSENYTNKAGLLPDDWELTIYNSLLEFHSNQGLTYSTIHLPVYL